MTLWNAANLYQLKLEQVIERELKKEANKAKDEASPETKPKWTERVRNPNTEIIPGILTAIKTFVLTAPLIVTSLVFNFSNIILGLINNSLFFALYMLAAFISLYLPATFSPAGSIKAFEEMMGFHKNTASGELELLQDERERGE